MSTPGGPEDPLTVAQVSAVVRAQLPALARLPVAPLGEGTDHQAFVVGGAHVLRFPRHAEAARTLEVEIRLTRWLAPRLPLAIPSYCHFGRPTAPSPCSFAGYPLLAGTPALLLADANTDLAAIGARLGAFLRVLHALDVDAAAALGVPRDDDPTLIAWSREALVDLEVALAHGHVPGASGAGWAALLGTPPAAAYGPRLIHADLAAEHVLLDDRGVAVGVIDWSDAAIGDPAQDLAGLIHWGGEAMLAAARATYGDVDEATLRRARWFAACRAVADIHFGLEQARQQYIVAGQRALAWLATPSP